MHQRDAYAVYLLLSGAGSFFFSMIATVSLVYQATTVGLNPLQLVLVGTVLEITCFLGEVPTGIVADVYSRRLSVIIGAILTGAGFIVEGAIPRFEAVLLAQVIWGLGATFSSGATEAWIADEVGEARAGAAFMRGAQAAQIGGLAGIVAAVALASLQLNLPIVLGGLLYVALGLLLLVIMPEHGFTPAPRGEQAHWRPMINTMRGGLGLVRRRPVLLTILIIIAVEGTYSEGFDRLWTPHLLEGFTLPTLGAFEPIVWFGVLRAGALLLSLVSTEVARKRVHANEHVAVARALFAVYGLIIGGTLAFALAGDFVMALAAYWVVAPLRRTAAPLFAAWLNQSIESRVRATVISMGAQFNAVGQIVGGPVVGVIATTVSLPVALSVATLALLPTMILYLRTIRMHRPARAHSADATVAE